MKVYDTDLPGVRIVEPRVFADRRGYFLEVYHQPRYDEFGLPTFVQTNLSRSRKGTLRGMHFQIQHAQGKLVHAICGAIFDVAVDLRRDSPHFGRWIGVELSDSNHRQLYVPPGFAHGFYVLSETADVLYQCTDTYHPEHERTLLWNDEAVGIDWPLVGEPALSEKDRQGQTLDELDCYDTTP